MGKWDFLHPYDVQVHSALAAGDVKWAFEVLLQGYQAVVVRYCTTLLADMADGEDVAQEVFVAVLRALPRYQPTALLRTWIFRIARNLCRKHQAKRSSWWRRQEEHRTGKLDTAGSGTFPSPEDLLQAHVDAERAQHQLHRLERSLRQFSSDDRALLMMYYYEELSFRAIALRLWKSEATVRRKVHAAEQRLRVLLLQEESV
jgi:RNA polymerase sigma-70 factor (ECF subfamily)